MRKAKDCLKGVYYPELRLNNTLNDMNTFSWLLLVFSLSLTLIQPWLGAGFLLLNLLTLGLYFIDKRASIKNASRISEKTLHIAAVLGGWPAALLGQHYFRHKTQKTSFIRILWCCILTNTMLVSGASYWYYSSATIQ